MDNIKITNARNDLYNIAKNIVETHEPLVLNSKTGDLVLISKEDFDSMSETLYLQTNKRLSKEIQKYNESKGDDLATRDDLPW